MKTAAYTIALIVVLSLAGGASTTKTFSEPKDRVAAAAQSSIEANGIMTSQHGADFLFSAAKTWGRVSIRSEQDGRTSVEVITSDGHGRKTEKAIIDGIEAYLEGRPIKVDQKSIDQAKDIERRRNFLASLPPPPPAATVLIQAGKGPIKSALIAECASKGFAIIAESEHQVTVAKETDAPFNLVGSVLFGPNATIKKYRANIQFMMIEEGDATRITPIAEIIATDGYGRTAAQMVTDDPQARIVLQSMLDGLKSRVEQVSAK